MKSSRVPTIVLFCGLPGSGKTTLAKQLEKEGKGLRICTDDWQADLGMTHNENNFRIKLQKKLYALALELLDYGQSVILEDGLWTKPERDKKLADAKKHGATIELHFFDLTFDEIWGRLASRNQNLPKESIHMTRQQLQKCWDIFQKPSSDELASFDSVVIYKDESK